MTCPPFQFVENPRSIKSACVRAGELEGAAARLEWDQMPRKPCCARLPASEARTFAPNSGAKVTAFLQAVGKVLGLFRQPAGTGHRPVPAFFFLRPYPTGRYTARGSRTVKVLPWSSTLSTWIWPPHSSTIRWTMDRPRPRPRPLPLGFPW